MSGQFTSIRTQFTLYVAVCSLLVIASLAALSVHVVKQQITSSTHQNAVLFLEDYLSQIGIGLPEDSSRRPLMAFSVFYLDETGKQLTNIEVNNLLDKYIDEFMAEQVGVIELLELNSAEYLSESVDKVITDHFEVSLIEQEDIDIKPIELSAETVAIGQQLILMDQALTIGVSYPLALIESRLAEIRYLFLWLIPVFVLLSGVATWLVVGHILKPIRLLIRDANRINERRVNQRLVEPVAENEFRSLALTLNAMLGRIEQAQNTQKQFVSDASHELRSPITATKLLLEVSGNSQESVGLEQNLVALTQENERLLRLVDDLLFLAQIDESDPRGILVNIDLEELLLEESNRPHKNAIELDITTAVRIRANKTQISAVVTNLLDNADRYANTLIRLGLYSSNEATAIRVEDDGPGIPEGKKEIIFERFSRVEESRERKTSNNSERTSGGAGLGLSIVAEIVTRNNGTILVSDSALGGACFTVYLPNELKWDA